MGNAENELNLTADKTVRIYCDISEDVERKMTLRASILGMERQKRMTRREYLEFLILQDVAKVQGASLSTVRRMKK